MRLFPSKKLPLPATPSVLITGAASGIGHACVQALLAKGWQVFAGVRSQHDVDRLKSEFSSPSGASCALFPMLLDVTEARQVADAAQWIKAQCPAGLNGLVNNAGLVVGGPIEAMPIESIEHQLQVNLLGQIRITQAMLPILRQATTQGNRASIINMSSISGFHALPYVAPYSMSKYALEALSDALRVELSPWQIGVSVIQPGSIATPIWQKSQQHAHFIAQQFTSEHLGLYRTALEKVHKASQRSAARAITPCLVANAVCHALQSSHPKTRYRVGADAQIRRLLRLLPDRWIDALVCWKLKLHHEPICVTQFM